MIISSFGYFYPSCSSYLPVLLPPIFFSDSTSLSFLPPVLSSFHHLTSYATTGISDYLNRPASPHFTTKEGIIPHNFFVIDSSSTDSVRKSNPSSPFAYSVSTSLSLLPLFSLKIIIYRLLSLISYLSHASHYCYPLIYYSLLLLPIFYILYSLL